MRLACGCKFRMRCPAHERRWLALPVLVQSRLACGRTLRPPRCGPAQPEHRSAAQASPEGDDRAVRRGPCARSTLARVLVQLSDRSIFRFTGTEGRYAVTRARMREEMT